MSFLGYVLAFLIFVTAPYLVLLTLGMGWWIARQIKHAMTTFLKFIEHPID